MTTLRHREKDTYDTAWALEAYHRHSPGEAYVPLFLDMAHPSRLDTILDAGCGAGKGALALKAAGFDDVRLCDLTDAGLLPDVAGLPFATVCLWHDLVPQLGYLNGRKVDWVYCCDVLEHVPPTFTMLVVDQLMRVARKGVFLSISLMPDHFGAWVGKPLHQTVQTFPQWKEQLNEVGTVREARDLLGTGIYLVTPRC